MGELTIYLVRHGDTAWSGVRRLAGRTDLPLVPEGEVNARALGPRLRHLAFDRVLASPLERARRTAELAGFASAELDERLVEMDFGDYDGRTIDEIRSERPGWAYLKDGSPGGETAADLGARADAPLAELGATGGTVLLFAHSVILRVLAVRFLGLPPEAGRMLMLSPGGVSVLAHDRVDAARAIAVWNDRRHLREGSGGFA